MKVIAIKEMGPDSQLVLEERDADPRPEGWSRIAVQAFGVNRADLLQRAGRYPAPRGVAADIPGLEFTGEVIETGNDSRWNVGDPVMGLVSGGGYSTEVICNDGHLLPKPANLSWEEAAGVVEAFLTAWDGMILQGNLSAGGTALIHAAGSGVGVAAVQLAKWTGASVTGTSRTPWKLERLKRDYGIKTVLRKNEWWENTQIDGRCDVVLDLVGGGETSRNVTCLRSQGTVVVVGLTAGVRTEVRLDQLLIRRARLIGTVLRSRTDEEKNTLFRRFEEEVLPALQSGKLRSPTEESYHVSAVEEAHRKVASNQTFGKVIVTWAG